MKSPTLPKEKAEFLRSILRPLVRLCFRNACSAYEVIEAVKGVFIEIAEDQIKEGGDKVTVSRVSVMTGIDRRDVKRISSGSGTPIAQPSLVTRVLGQWEQNPRFSTRAHSPKVLSYKGENSEFKRLVNSVSKDMNPATMLYELQRLGHIDYSEEKDQVKLLRAVNMLEAEPEKKLSVISKNFETLGQSCEENIFENSKTKHLNLRTEYDNIFEDDIPKIREWLLKQGMVFHKKARTFLARFDKDLNPRGKKKGGAKVALVAFSWASPGSKKRDS